MGNWAPVIKTFMTWPKGFSFPPPLEVYTTYSGGRQYAFKSQRELERAVSDLGEELHSQYLLTYVPDKDRRLRPDTTTLWCRYSDREMKIRARDGYYWAGTGKAP